MSDTEREEEIHDPVKMWEARLTKEAKAHDKYRRQAKKASEAAQDDGPIDQKFNIHWSNCSIIRNAVYGALPKPDVRRRFQKPSPVEKELARLVQRAIEYQVDSGDFDNQSDMVVKDFVECGLGVPRIIYDVATAPIPDVPSIESLLMQQVTGETPEPTYDDGLEEITSQSVSIEHVPWKRFRWEPGKAWKHLGWICFDSMKPVKEVNEQFGVNIKGSGKNESEKEREASKYTDEVLVHEIYVKRTRTVLVLAEGHDEVLEERKDTLGLKGFFPCPMPIATNIKSDELIPKPDFSFVANQILELNRTTQRIDKLVQNVKDIGFYDPAIADELGKVMKAADGTLVPVPNMAANLDAAGGGGQFDKAIAWLPMMDKVVVIRELQQQREALKVQIYETMGISDIIRGSSHQNETAAAQQMKGQWAGVRLSDKTIDVSRIWREVFRMFAEVMCEHFDPMQLSMMTGIEVTPEMQEIMESDIGRSFAIDVETDSTIAKDDLEERQQTMEMIDVLVAKMEVLVPAVMQGQIPLELMQEIMMMILSKHKHGKTLEDAIMGLNEHIEGGLGQQMQQMQQQMQQMQMELQQAGEQNQAMGQELEKRSQGEEARDNATTQADVAETQVDTALKQQELQTNQAETRMGAVETEADVTLKGQEGKLKEAQTAKTWREALAPEQQQETDYPGPM